MSLWNLGTSVGTHALVIGVSDYPALPGGSGTLFSTEVKAAPRREAGYAT